MPQPFIIPNQARLEKRFSFIQEETLQKNIIITFRYIIFLSQLKQENLPSLLSYSIYKDIIVQTATVIESCVHYALKTFIDEGKIKNSDIMEQEWKENKCIVIETFDNGTKQICGVTRHKIAGKLTRHTTFMELNRACKRAGIYTLDVFKKAEALREARNKIHLAGLSEIDDIYTKDDVDKYFDYARMILACLEERLRK